MSSLTICHHHRLELFNCHVCRRVSESYGCVWKWGIGPPIVIKRDAVIRNMMINHWIWGDSTFSDKAIFIFGQRPKQRNSPSCDTEKPQELWMMLKEPEFSAEAHHELNLDSSLSRNASPVFGKSLRLFTQPLLLVYLHWDLESGYIQISKMFWLFVSQQKLGSGSLACVQNYHQVYMNIFFNIV